MIKKLAVVLALALVMTTGFTGCGSKPAAAPSSDIVTQKPEAQGRLPITVLVKYAFSINNFEEAAEKQFPELDIIQVGNYTYNMGVAEYAARMEHDDLTDVVMTWPLDVGKAYWGDRLMELSAMPFTQKYVVSMLDNISQDGKLYYLPGPSQVRGIVYNKTLFQENGWAVPTDFDSFVALCKEIEASGMRSLQLGLQNAEVLDTAFVGYGYNSSLSKPQNAQWLQDYNSGKGKFYDNFKPALDTFQALIDAGILKPADLEVDYPEREFMLFNRTCAMIEDSVLLARMGQDYNGCTDSFALMPFFNPDVDSDWARLYPVCYIGVNKKLEQPENKEKLELVTKLLEYISTPEGQNALASDTGAMFSSLNGVAPPDMPEIVDLMPALTHGRYAVFPTLQHAQGALRTGLTGMILGELTGQEVADLVDAENLAPPVTPASKVLGTASDDFSLIETGCFITDTMRAYSGSEIALYLDNGKDGQYNGKGVSGKIYKGDITEEDLLRILPDFKQAEKGELMKVVMTGESLLSALEYSIPVNNDLDGWFYYFSGLKMEYAPTAKPGSRIKSITDEAGNPIDPKKEYTVAISDSSVSENLIQSSEPVNLLVKDMLAQELAKVKEITPSKDGRFVVAAP